jgi:hypothetical protein
LQSLQGPSSTQLTSSGGGIHRAIAPIPAPPSPDEPPMYVNAKQYARIVKRREWRARMEQEGRLPKGRSVSRGVLLIPKKLVLNCRSTCMSRGINTHWLVSGCRVVDSDRARQYRKTVTTMKVMTVIHTFANRHMIK